MAHGDTVIHGYRIEFLAHPAGFFDFADDQLPHVFQVNMPRHELGKGIGNGDDRLVKVAIFHAGGPPQGAGTRHVAALGGGV